MAKKKDVLDFIKVVRESNDKAVDIYTEGGCYKFYKILKAVFPTAKPYSEKSCPNCHIVTKIGRAYYDITGQVKGEFLELTKEQEKTAAKFNHDFSTGRAVTILSGFSINEYRDISEQLFSYLDEIDHLYDKLVLDGFKTPSMLKKIRSISAKRFNTGL
jgi:hypothetical protein